MITALVCDRAFSLHGAIAAAGAVRFGRRARTVAASAHASPRPRSGVGRWTRSLRGLHRLVGNPDETLAAGATIQVDEGTILTDTFRRCALSGRVALRGDSSALRRCCGRTQRGLVGPLRPAAGTQREKGEGDNDALHESSISALRFEGWKKPRST